MPPDPVSLRSSLLLLSHLRLGQVVSFHQVSPPKACMHMCCLPYVLHTLPISLVFLLSPEYYLVSSTGHKPRFYSFPLPCYLVHLSPEYIPKHPILEHPPRMFLP